MTLSYQINNKATTIRYDETKYKIRYFFQRICPKFLYPLILEYKHDKYYNLPVNLFSLYSKKNNIKTLSKKIQWLKIYDNSELKTRLTDKLALKSYIKDFLPELKTAKVYKVFKSYKDINFDDLPDEFVLKTNHSWKTNIHIKNKKEITKEDLNVIKNYYKNALKINYAYWSFFELQYNGIKPQVYAEEFYGNIFDVVQYEIWCFNGEPEFIYVSTSKNLNGYYNYTQGLYDSDWNKMDFSFFVSTSNIDFLKPENLSQMIEYAKKLSKNFKLVRIDFAQSKDNLYLNEITFTPYSGFINFYGNDKNLYYGNKLNLN